MFFTSLSVCFYFFFNGPAPTEIYTLSLHDALPISQLLHDEPVRLGTHRDEVLLAARRVLPHRHALRSEEHTSELQSRVDLVCRLLLEKKKPHIRSHTAQSVREP